MRLCKFTFITVIARVARDLWQHKQTLSSGFALGLSLFTAINRWPRATTITKNAFYLKLKIQTLTLSFIRFETNSEEKAVTNLS